MPLKLNTITSTDLAAWNPPPFKLDPLPENPTLEDRVKCLESGLSQMAYRLAFANECYEQLLKRMLFIEMQIKDLLPKLVSHEDVVKLQQLLKEFLE